MVENKCSMREFNITSWFDLNTLIIKHTMSFSSGKNSALVVFLHCAAALRCCAAPHIVLWQRVKVRTLCIATWEFFIIDRARLNPSIYQYDQYAALGPAKRTHPAALICSDLTAGVWAPPSLCTRVKAFYWSDRSACVLFGCQSSTSLKSRQKSRERVNF